MHMDIIVQFAVLWGQYIGSAVTPREELIAKEMDKYDYETLLDLFTKWTDEYFKQDVIEKKSEFF